MIAEVVTEQTGAVLRMTLSAPKTKNAITNDMYRQLVAGLKQAEEDPAIRAVLLRGEGGVFTSGNDINSFVEAAKTGDLAAVTFLETLIPFGKPIVAQVEGLAIGVGATMLLHCDMVIAAQDTTLQMPFVNLGLVPEAGASYIVPRLVGQAKAAELILLGRAFSGTEAAQMGFINLALPVEEVAAAAEQALQGFVKQPPESLRKSKALLRAPLVGEVMQRVRAELVDFKAALAGPEFAEAAIAFREKRAPKF